MRPPLDHEYAVRSYDVGRPLERRYVLIRKEGLAWRDIAEFVGSYQDAKYFLEELQGSER